MFIETLFVLACWPEAPADEPREKPLTPDEQYKALAEEFTRAARGLWEAKTDEDRAKVAADGSKLPARLLELAEKDPASSVAQTALLHAVTAEMWIENKWFSVIVDGFQRLEGSAEKWPGHAYGFFVIPRTKKPIVLQEGIRVRNSDPFSWEDRSRLSPEEAQ